MFIIINKIMFVFKSNQSLILKVWFDKIIKESDLFGFAYELTEMIG